MIIVLRRLRYHILSLPLPLPAGFAGAAAAVGGGFATALAASSLNFPATVFTAARKVLVPLDAAVSNLWHAVSTPFQNV